MKGKKYSEEKIIPLGYVAPRSSHSRGSTVDLTIVALDGDGGESDFPVE
jgi:D-alanyl-D-alanine dipeptidase